MLTSSRLDAAVAEARARFEVANPRSRAAWLDACRVLPGGNTRTVLFHAPFPLRMVRGEGCRVWDADGHEYVDLLGEYTAGLFGHSHPVILDAVRAALDGGINLSGHTVAEARLAAAVCERFGLDLVRFTNSGTEANLLALATATVVTGRRRVLVFDGAYHGGLLVFAGGGAPINVPHEFVVGEYNDVAGTGELFDQHGDDLAAVLVEPMIGAGGCIPGEEAFLHLLAERARACGALLVLDEVMTSRLAPGGRQAQLGITPDLTTLGKYLAGGLSFGAFGGRGDLMARYDPRRPDALPHAGTFNNNVLSMAAGLAALTECLTPEALGALNARGDALRSRLDALCADAPLRFTGLGSLLGVHATRGPIRTPADAAAADGPVKELLFLDLLERGIHLARRGFIALSLPVGDAECQQLLRAVEAFLEHRADLLAEV